MNIKSIKFMHYFTFLFMVLVGCTTQPQSDQTGAVREQIYMHYFAETHASDRFVYFVAESDTFITALKSASGLTYIEHSSTARYDHNRDETIHMSTGKAGIKLKISDIVIDGNAASAKFKFTATSICAGDYSVHLLKKSGRWVITVWQMDRIS